MVVRLILGDDPVLVGEAVTAAVDELVGDGDRSLMFEELTESDYRTDTDDFEPARLLNAARTPPFLSDKRVVVGRHLSRFARKDDYAPLLELLKEPLDTTDVVLVWERGIEPKVDRLPAVPKPLKEAVEAAGGSVQQTAAPRAKGDVGKWLRDQLADSTLEFDRAAIAAIADLIGEDKGRIVGLVRTLEGVCAPGTTVTAQDITTYGGHQPGSAMPWDLEGPIDKGDVAGALELLRRLIPYAAGPTDRTGAAFRLMATLQKRYGNMLRLDGAGVRDEKEAARLLGMKGSTYPAKKAMQQSRRLGTEKLAQAIRLLAEADLQLRGTVDWPPELVMEVLVARLASLSSRR